MILVHRSGVVDGSINLDLMDRELSVQPNYASNLPDPIS